MLLKKDKEVNAKIYISSGIGSKKLRMEAQDRYDRELTLAVEEMTPLKHGRKPCKIHRHGYYDRSVTLLEEGVPVTVTLHVARLKYFYDDGHMPSSETSTFQGTLFLLKGTRAAIGLIVSMIRDVMIKGKPVGTVAGLHGFSRSSYYRLKARLKEIFYVSVSEADALSRLLTAT